MSNKDIVILTVFGLTGIVGLVTTAIVVGYIVGAALS